MTWADFDADSALERDLLSRALPLVPLVSDGSSTAILDMRTNTAQVGVTLHETLGPNPAGCVKLLGIRPLLVGAAWKVLDLLLEEALRESGEQPDTPRGWSITRKVAHARAGDAQPAQIDATAWHALTNTYAETSELRHSLVHRRAHIDSNDALVGVSVSVSGGTLRPLPANEQEALVRASLRAAELVVAAFSDERTSADLVRQLGLLHGLHGEALPQVSLSESLPEITVIIDPGPDGSYRLDVPALCARQPFKEATHADLVVRFRDRPGQDLRGRFEAAPSDTVVLDPDSPPPWLV